MKKIITVILIILVLTAGAWLLWRWTSAPSDINPPPATGNGGGGGLFFPSGQVNNGGNNSGDGNLVVGTNATGTDALGQNPSGIPSDFNKISERPVAGATLVASTTIVYMDKATGHLYALESENLAIPARQITNTTIPKVNQFFAGQTKDGLMVIARYLKGDQIQNFSASLVNSFGSSTEPFRFDRDETAELRGAFLGPNIYEIIAAPRQDRIFYLEKTPNNQGSVGYLAKWDGSGKSLVFSSPLIEWLAAWPNDNTLALQTKTSSAVGGSLYLIDLKTKKDRLVFSDIPGLSTRVNPNAKKTLYSGNTTQGTVFGVYALADNFFNRLPVTTLAEKCVWSQNNVTIYCAVPQRLSGALPEDWYQGKISFADNIWKIDTETKQAEIIYNPSIARLGQEIDATLLFLNSDETTLFLIDKRDQELWALNLESAFRSAAASSSDETTTPGQ